MPRPPFSLHLALALPSASTSPTNTHPHFSLDTLLIRKALPWPPGRPPTPPQALSPYSSLSVLLFELPLPSPSPAFLHFISSPTPTPTPTPTQLPALSRTSAALCICSSRLSRSSKPRPTSARRTVQLHPTCGASWLGWTSSRNWRPSWTPPAYSETGRAPSRQIGIHDGVCGYVGGRLAWLTCLLPFFAFAPCNKCYHDRSARGR